MTLPAGRLVPVPDLESDDTGRPAEPRERMACCRCGRRYAPQLMTRIVAASGAIRNQNPGPSELLCQACWRRRFEVDE